MLMLLGKVWTERTRLSGQRSGPSGTSVQRGLRTSMNVLDIELRHRRSPRATSFCLPDTAESPKTERVLW